MVSITEKSEPRITIKHNLWAKHQLVIRVKGPGENEIVKILKENEQEIINIIQQEERKRSVFSLKGALDHQIMQKLKQKHNIEVPVPVSFDLYMDKDNFVWMGKEKSGQKQYIFIYYYPYKDTNTFTIDYIMDKRDSVMKQHVEGNTEESYMTTEREFKKPVMNEFRHDGNYIAETRGLWKMVNGDIMGGSFVNLATVDKKRNRVVHLEGFVYAPNKEHRDLTRYLESVIYHFDFPNGK